MLSLVSLLEYAEIFASAFSMSVCGSSDSVLSAVVAFSFPLADDDTLEGGAPLRGCLVGGRSEGGGGDLPAKRSERCGGTGNTMISRLSYAGTLIDMEDNECGTYPFSKRRSGNYDKVDS